MNHFIHSANQSNVKTGQLILYMEFNYAILVVNINIGPTKQLNEKVINRKCRCFGPHIKP